LGGFGCCEGEDRTPDLWVMSPTSYRCSTSRCGRKGNEIMLASQKISWYYFCSLTKHNRLSMKKIIGFAAIVIVGLSACEKNNDDTVVANASCPLNQTSILGTYKITSLQYYNAGSTTPRDSLANYPSCERDNVYVLNANNAYEYKDLGTICVPVSGGVGTWSLGNQTFVIDRKVGIIENFDCNGFTVLETDLRTNGDKLRTVYTRQ
jgi:hypothetical protein